MFIKDLALYICKGYQVFSTTKNVWLKRLVLCQCPQVSFLSQIVFVDDVFPTMVKKTLDFHVLPNLASTTIISTSFDLWMLRGRVDNFALVRNFLNESWTSMHVLWVYLK
jgi:hypothetical protein